MIVDRTISSSRNTSTVQGSGLSPLFYTFHTCIVQCLSSVFLGISTVYDRATSAVRGSGSVFPSSAFVVVIIILNGAISVVQGLSSPSLAWCSLPTFRVYLIG